MLGFRKKCCFLLTALSVALAPTSAFADPIELDVAPNDTWEHQWTEMEFPQAIGEFKREEVFQFEDREGNVSSRYSDPSSETVLSVYIFRPGQPDSSIWHDRALEALKTNTQMGPFDLASRETRRFTPSGGTVESGILSIFGGRGNYESTGVALYQAGDWLIKIRISSIKLGVKPLSRELDHVLASLPEMSGIATTPAYTIENCSDDIAFTPAARVSADDGDPFDLSVAGSILEVGTRVKSEQSEPKVQYCHQGERRPRYGLYRPNGALNQYLFAFGDAGFSIDISEAPGLSTILAEGRPDDTPTKVFRVSTANALELKQYRPFKSLPTPQQAADAAFNEAPMSSMSRPFGDDGATITIFTNDEGGEE